MQPNVAAHVVLAIVVRRFSVTEVGGGGGGGWLSIPGLGYPLNIG